jgi:hypothetical protein
MINYLKVSLFGIGLFFFIAFGMDYWLLFFPLAIIANIILISKTIQEKYLYDLKFWFGMMNIIDAVIVIAYVISLSLYLTSKQYFEIYNLINLFSFGAYMLNHSSKEEYLSKRSKFALPYVDFNESPKNIKNKIYNIFKYNLLEDDIEMLRELLEKDITIDSYDDDYKKHSAYILTYHQFALKNNQETPYQLTINKKIIPYISEYTKV